MEVHYTSVAQSNELLGLGLDKSTADMVYLKYADSNNLTFRFEGAAPMVLMDIPIDEIDCETLACWSDGRLVELMPAVITTGDSFRDKYKIEIRKDPYQIAYGNSFGFRGKWRYIVNTPQCDKFIDACCHMMSWLFQNNHLTKN